MQPYLQYPFFELALKISNENLTVRALEQLVKEMQENKEKPKVTKEVTKDIYIESLEEQMMNKLGTSVKINVKEESNGKIVIDFFNTADLNRILELLNLLDSPLQ